MRSCSCGLGSCHNLLLCVSPGRLDAAPCPAARACPPGGLWVAAACFVCVYNWVASSTRCFLASWASGDVTGTAPVSGAELLGICVGDKEGVWGGAVTGCVSANAASGMRCGSTALRRLWELGMRSPKCRDWGWAWPARLMPAEEGCRAAWGCRRASGSASGGGSTFTFASSGSSAGASESSLMLAPGQQE